MGVIVSCSDLDVYGCSWIFQKSNTINFWSGVFGERFAVFQWEAQSLISGFYWLFFSYNKLRIHRTDLVRDWVFGFFKKKRTENNAKFIKQSKQVSAKLKESWGRCIFLFVQISCGICIRGGIISGWIGPFLEGNKAVEHFSYYTWVLQSSQKWDLASVYQIKRWVKKCVVYLTLSSLSPAPTWRSLTELPFKAYWDVSKNHWVKYGPSHFMLLWLI